MSMGDLTLIEQATPTSAIHPPSAAEIVAPRLKSMPMAEAVRRKVMMLMHQQMIHVHQMMRTAHSRSGE